MEKHILQGFRAADSQCGVLRAGVGARCSAKACLELVDRPVRFLTRQISTSRHFLSWSVQLLAVLVSLCSTPNAGATLFTAGEAVDLGNSANAAGNYLYFFPATVAKSGQLLKLGIIVRSVSSPYQGVLGIYASDGVGGTPGTRLASTAPFTISAAGVIEVVTTNQPVLASGTYWICANYQATTTQAYAPMSATNYYKAQAYSGTLPPTVSGLTKSTGQRWNHYAVLEADYTSVEIEVQQPVGIDVPTGGSRTLAAITGDIASLTFTVTNCGPGTLELSGISLGGEHPGDFVVRPPVTNSLAARSSTALTVEFAATNDGIRTAVLRMTNNDTNEGNFEINLAGRALSAEQDTDGDGLNDAAEFLLAGLGFDWQVNQSELVATLFRNASAAGLYAASQMQAMRATTPLLLRNPTNGMFTLTIAVQRATNLTDFASFPMTSEQIRINPQGELQFDFMSPDNTALFRLQSH